MFDIIISEAYPVFLENFFSNKFMVDLSKILKINGYFIIPLPNESQPEKKNIENK